MDKEQYVKKILKYVVATDQTKERMKLDLLTGIESKEESGLTMEEIVSQMGSPKDVARDFNQNYPECVYGKKKRKMSMFTVICAVTAAVCFAVGRIGRLVYLGGSAAPIGGADKPTGIQVISGPFSALTIYDGLIKIAVVFLLITILSAIYLFVKDRKKSSQ